MSRLENLSPADRKAVERAIARKSSTKERVRPRLSRAEPPGEDGGGRCVCGQAFPSYKAWEKHNRTDPAGHARYNMTITVVL